MFFFCSRIINFDLVFVSSRFVLNVPEEDQQSFERILFLVEYAYYEDNAVENDPTLKSLSLKEFTSLYYACAMREVLEETGFDISKLLKKEEYIEFTFRQQRLRLYIVAGVADDTAFAPQTKKEISEIAWHWVDHLQPASNEVITHGVAGLKLYMVAPFLASLKSWISKHPAPVARRPDKPLRALSVWNAKTSIGGGNGTTTTTTESYNKKPEEQDTISGNAFRSFKFNMSAILQAVELG
ncbi:hypothetical protein YC2023_034529 [Brassica napus]